MHSISNATPPGPTASGFLGLLPDFLRSPMEFLNSLRPYGPVVRFRLLKHDNYLLTSPELIGKVLTTRQHQFIKNRGFWKRYAAIFGNGLITNEGESWRQQRKLAAPSFQHKRLAFYVNHMLDYTTHMLDVWQPGQIRDIHQDMMQVTAEIAMRALFNVEFSAQDYGLHNATQQLEAQIAVRLGRPFPLLDYLPTAANIRYWRALRTIDRQLALFIEQQRHSPERKSLLSTLMDARYEDGSALSDRQLRDETITLFLAGHDTTAITLSWAFYLLSQHPQYWALLRQEWASVLQDRQPGIDDLPQLPLTRGVIRETLRLYPPAYMIGREALEDVQLGGFRIPKGKGVVISAYVMGRHPEYFPQPELFRPERWTTEFEKELPRYAFIPFGGGPRTCIGEGFALLEAMIVLILTGRRFNLCYAGDNAPVPLASITMPPRDGMRMQCEVLFHRT